MIITTSDGKQSVDFVIPEQCNKPGMWISGGADSAILLYMLVIYLRETGRERSSMITLFTCANDEKLRWNAQCATAVIDQVIKLTGTSAINRHITIYRDRQDISYFHEIDRWAFDSGTIDILLSGKTANPRESSVTVEDSYGRSRDIMADPYRAADRDAPSNPVMAIFGDRAFYNPFLHSDKRLVAAAYDAFDLRQSLLPLTRSCEALPRRDDRGAMEIPEPCGDCWWCLERKWAFGSW